ncbi:MAG: aminotransferase class IV, partial [Candidatus Falkowbacteria bacterium]
DGFQFGRGVFETILVKEEPLLFDRHFDRLTNGISAIGINNDVKREELLEAIRKHNIRNCVLKIIVTEKNIVLVTRESAYKKEDYEKGFGLKVSNLVKDENSRAVYIKSLARLDSMLEKEKALGEGYEEAVFLNTKGFVTEACNSNIFFVKDGIIYTPSIECGLLNGVIRCFVVDNFDVTVGKFTMDQLMLADEAFLTNSVLGIMKVKSIGGRKLDDFSVYHRVRNKYNWFYENCH